MRRGVGGLSLRFAVVALAGGLACNAIVGIEEPNEIAATKCLHNSDCPKASDVCLSEHCAAPCVGDRDCPDGRCLKTGDESAACVTAVTGGCDDEGDCPGVAICSNGACRNDCSADPSSCLEGQTCRADGVCVGDDLEHDPAAGGGSAGTGSGGRGGSAGGSGGRPAGGNGGEGGEGAAPGGCEEGSIVCAGAASPARRVCRDGELVLADACGEGKLCDTGSDPRGKCLPIVEACSGQPPGAAVCEGATRIACGPDLVTVQTDECSSVAYCQAAKGPDCAVCLEDEYKCSGTQLSVCNSDRTGFDPVMDCTDEPCNATLGRCTTEVCDPSQFTCDAQSNTLRKCNEDGTDFASEIECGDGVCDAENGECDVCVAGTVEGCTDGHRKKVCDEEGQGTISVECAAEDPQRPVCIGNGLCRQCTPSATECVDKFRAKTCSTGGTWDSPTQCTGQACASNVCTGSCEPESTECENSTQIKVCSDTGQMGNPMDCDAMACVNDACTGICTPSSTKCRNKFSLQTCGDNGSYDLGVDCVDSACVDGACVGECVPDTLHCLDKFTIQTCDDAGQLGNDASCTGKACYNDACVGSCVPGTVECANNSQFTTCQDNGTPGQAVSCNNQACVGSACTGMCSPGAQRCDGTNKQQPQLCSSTGTYGNDGSACSGTWATICRVVGGDAQCVSNPPYTVGKTSQLSQTQSVNAGQILGNAVTITEKVAIVKFGIWVAQSVAGCHLRMSIYSDSGGSPGTPVSYSTEVFNLTVGNQQLDPEGGQSFLDAGRYWVMAHYGCPTVIYDLDMASEPDLKYQVAAYVNGAAPPNPLPMPLNVLTTFSANHYLSIQTIN